MAAAGLFNNAVAAAGLRESTVAAAGLFKIKVAAAGLFNVEAHVACFLWTMTVSRSLNPLSRTLLIGVAKSIITTRTAMAYTIAAAIPTASTTSYTAMAKAAA